MNQNQFEQWLKIQERQAIALEKIANLLQSQRPREPAPNYEATLEDFNNFAWESINCKVKEKDRFGVTLVSYNNQVYQRRSPENAYATAIYFSRCIGRGEDGSNKYERLITFKPADSYKVRPISRQAEQVIYK